jgi:phage tail-like protein
VNGNIQRKNGSVVICDRAGKEVVRWNFTNAWPCKWTGPQLTSEGNDIAIESLELAYETLELAK